MKHLFYAFMLIGTLVQSTLEAQTERRGYGVVSTRLGYELYVLSEPIKPYEEIFTVDKNNLVIPTNADGVDPVEVSKPKGPVTISDKTFELVALVKEKEAGEGNVDAIIYDGGHIVKAIRFVDDDKRLGKGIGKVRKQAGVDVYIFCEPTVPIKYKSKWTVNESKKKGFTLIGKVGNSLTQDSSIEYDFNEYFNRLTKKRNRDKWPEGVIYDSSGKISGFDYR